MNFDRNFITAVGLGLVIAAAAVLYSWNISNQDMLGDEVAYAFRSIGYIDYLGTSFQSQPVDWYEDAPIPWWTKLSFHDHPPLVFLIQHFFFSLFGDSLAVAKLPAMTFGILSLILVFVLARRAFRNGGSDPYELWPVFTALLYGVSLAAVLIYRSSLMEPILIFFILLNVYLFFRFVENPSRWFLWGVSLGLVALTKYTGVFLLPAYFTYLVLFNRKLFADRRFWSALTVAVIVFSPVIIYNAMLYKTRGHFDLQISYLLGQETPEWTALVGKEQAPVSDYFKNALALYSFGFAAFGILGLLIAVIRWARKSRGENAIALFFALYIVFLTLTLLEIGVAHRFLTLYAPALAILGVLFLRWAYDRVRPRSIILILGAVFIGFEAWLSVTTYITGAWDYGISKLDRYFDQEFAGKVSGVIPESDNYNLNLVIKKFAEARPKAERHLSMIIYNDNVVHGTLAWIFYRRFFYHGIPTLYVENFQKVLQKEGVAYFKDVQLYFVQSTPNTLLNQFKRDKTVGDVFEDRIVKAGQRTNEVILGKDGKEMFRVYKFVLS